MKKRGICSVILFALLLGILCGCKPTSPNPSGTTGGDVSAETTTRTEDGTSEAEVTTTEEPVTTTAPIFDPGTPLTLVSNGNTSFKIIFGQKASAEAMTAISSLRGVLKDTTSASFGMLPDSTPEKDKEFIVGHTTRADEKAFRAELAADHTYAFGIKVTEKKVIVTATHEDFVPMAVDYFVAHYLETVPNGTVTLKDGTYQLTTNAGVVISGEKSDLSVISKDHTYATVSEHIAYAPIKNGNFKILQGGCATEDYYWAAVINTADYDFYAAGVYIYKYDAKTWKLLKRTQVLMLDHANDITYRPDTNEIYVVHCYTDARKVTVMDADTLEVKRTERSSGLQTYGFYSLTYDAERKIFIAGNGKTNMVFFDENLSFKKYKAGASTKLTTQGICSDSNYIYHVLFSTAKSPDEPYNMIYVYDSKMGNLANKIRLSISGQEPENISVVNGAFIIGCNNSSSSAFDVYKCTLIDFGDLS